MARSWKEENGNNKSEKQTQKLSLLVFRVVS
jgi:hypothetical protein